MGKIATDLEQSKKLLELGLNPETADMEWVNLQSDDGEDKYELFVNSTVNHLGMSEDIPAWSLSALIDLIPKEYPDGLDINYFTRTFDCRGNRLKQVWHIHLFSSELKLNRQLYGSTLIDVCYDTIVWLLEEGCIEKGDRVMTDKVLILEHIEELRKSFNEYVKKGIISPENFFSKDAVLLDIKFFIHSLDKEPELLTGKTQLEKITAVAESMPRATLKLSPTDNAVSRDWNRRMVDAAESLGISQEEPVSIWHDSNEEQPNFASAVAIWNPKYKNGEIILRCTKVYPDRIWAYIDDLLKM